MDVTTGGLFAGTYLLVMVAALIARRFEREQHVVRAAPLASEEAPLHPAVVITLIHGTWAQDAAWTRPESDLCADLMERFEAVILHRFQWSGGNSTKSRSTAATALTTHLAEALAEFPDAKHFMIAHSHGGNIALSALNQELSERLTGIICLATPVFVSRVRNIDSVSRRLIPWLGISPAIMAVWLQGPALLSISLSWSLFALIIYLERDNLSKWLDAIFRIPNLDHLPRDKALFLRAPGDEATGAISTAHMLSWIVSSLATLPMRLYGSGTLQLEKLRDWSHGHQATIIIGILIWSVIWWMIYEYLRVWHPPPQWYGPRTLPDDLLIFREISELAAVFPIFFVILFFIGRILTVLLVYLFLPFLLIPVFLAAAVAGIVIGVEMAFAALVREVTVEPCPPGLWNVAVIVETAEICGEDIPTLQHSVVYQSLDARRMIVDWITARCAAGLSPL